MLIFLPEAKFGEWDDFVTKHDYGTIYHTSLWLRIIQETFGLPPLILTDYQNGIKCGLPLFLHRSLLTGTRLCCITGAQYCNPLVDNDDQLEELLFFLRNFMKRNAIGHFELKTSNDFKKNAELLEHAILSTGYSTHSLLLDRPYDKIRNNYHKSCIERPLKKALKSNIKIIRANSSEDIRIFYSIYRLMRKEKGLLPQPLMFFMNMYLLLSKSGLCDVFFASYDGTIVSSVFNIKFKDTYYYEYGATLFRYLGLHPSHFLLDRSIRLAIDEGYNVFNLGRTDKTNIGLSEFKERWGGTKTELKYYSLSNSGPKLPIQKKALPRISRKVIKYAPLPIYDLIGPIIYKAAF